jgi:pyridoxamine 5'-phosphate oxidase
MDLNDLRREYLKDGLSRDQLEDNPVDQFQKWLKQAIELEIKDPTAMSVATVDAKGQPRQRLVLLKQVDNDGFVFFTNYESKKARDIALNPLVSLHFPWHVLERQVKICGRAEKVDSSESLKYFLSRPEESQLAAWASQQSSRLSSRQALLGQFAAMKEKFKGGSIPLPDFWGGFRVVPSSIEFWQGGSNRLHDRFEYTRNGDQWDIQRLAP